MAPRESPEVRGLRQAATIGCADSQVALAKLHLLGKAWLRTVVRGPRGEATPVPPCTRTYLSRFVSRMRAYTRLRFSFTCVSSGRANLLPQPASPAPPATNAASAAAGSFRDTTLLQLS
jgi:hypothetical protein